MSKPKRQTGSKGNNKQKSSSVANVAALVDNIASQNVPEYHKILLQLRVFKEKGMYSTALQLFKKGLKIIQQELQKAQDAKTKDQLNLIRARYTLFCVCMIFINDMISNAIYLQILSLCIISIL